MTHEPWTFWFLFGFFLHDSALNVILTFSGSAENQVCVCRAGELVYVLETATGIH